MGGLKPANPKACANCPWRMSNRGKRQHGFFTKKNLRRLWAGMRRGERMTCHPTDDRMNEWDGFNIPDGRDAFECTGSLILKQREFTLMQDMLDDDPRAGLQRYRRERPRGLTRAGLVRVLDDTLFGGSPLGGLKVARPNLNDLDVQYPEAVGTWTARKAEG